ncbi:hypothetical protein BABINDRAFT_160571 [Babjeviella inositovora NRRL Y-12698]|uniref:sphinganine-1-phosphate aldolase n=1 Tax=Babjeviella inositovora NRRL Y-12698 TaxID=984486 RepID=A0A1E3QU09_9ASCO|nr:uncharacterized protein BABINDRAFT_160571 [Babjeviella inositovora NRRL Y-12698]ODQ81178.1 hypothetical protein BABINDRAFT_160571 [Babjeviella inositovora NRRL Y-12698]
MLDSIISRLKALDIALQLGVFEEDAVHYYHEMRHQLRYVLLKEVIFLYVVYRIVLYVVLPLVQQVYAYGPVTVLQRARKTWTGAFFRWFLASPLARARVDKEVAKNIANLEGSLIVSAPGLCSHSKLPAVGIPTETVLDTLTELSQLKHSAWEAGKVSGAVYHGGDDIIALQSQAFQKNCVANQLHPDVFPGVRKMESEVVAMVLDMYNAPVRACGTSSSGGTESLLLACLAAKVYGARYKGISSPEIVAPVTIHAGVDKAAYYFGIKLHKARVDPKTMQVDLSQVKRLINRNTVLLCGSSPNFPHGIIDDIQGMSDLAVRYDIPLHVDSCLGSFITPFANKAGFHDVPICDFRVPGVTSISCDTHKYGFAPKGSSVIMYRDNKMRECQYYVNVEWSGGVYGSPTLAGSRPGALMAGCWATMMNIGEDGYVKSAQEIIQASRDFKAAVQRIPQLRVLGDPLGSVVSFTVAELASLNIYELSDAMSAKGWHLSTLQTPAAVHIAFTRLSSPVIHELVADLQSVVDALVEEGIGGKTKPLGDTAALYGVAGSVTTTGVIDRLVVGFLDTLYKCDVCTDGSSREL